MLILVSNDDGVQAEGVRALAGAMRKLGDVVVIAPDREQSAAGHSLTLSRPLRCQGLGDGWYGVDGTPTDCIALGVMGILKRRPDLVVAGINLGLNLGDDITYSGTVSAAFEGTLLGIPSFAVSLEPGDPWRFDAAAEFALVLARMIVERGLPPDTLLNVNVPNRPLSEIRRVSLTRQGRRIYSETVVEKVDPRGKTYYWIGGAEPTWDRSGDTDVEAVMAGEISVTPLHLDLTNHGALRGLRDWTFPLGQSA